MGCDLYRVLLDIGYGKPNQTVKFKKMKTSQLENGYSYKLCSNSTDNNSFILKIFTIKGSLFVKKKIPKNSNIRDIVDFEISKRLASRIPAKCYIFKDKESPLYCNCLGRSYFYKKSEILSKLKTLPDYYLDRVGKYMIVGIND